MARIAHLSDIHFGSHDAKIVAATEAWLQKRQPDLVIISGDFTQRARVSQFREAAAYVSRLRAAGHKLLVVPGNHDVPLYDVFARFAAPLGRYKRHISNDLCPWFENDEISVLGINTARSLTVKDGRINHEQIALMKERFAAVDRRKTRILVTHHPLFAMPIGEGGELSEAVGRHDDAVKGACEAGVHLALAGHFHRTYAEAARKMTEKAGSAIIIQAVPPPQPACATQNHRASTGCTWSGTTDSPSRSSPGTAPPSRKAMRCISTSTEASGTPMRRGRRRSTPLPSGRYCVRQGSRWLRLAAG